MSIFSKLRDWLCRHSSNGKEENARPSESCGRFTSGVEKLLRDSGWYEGRWIEDNLKDFSFELHLAGKNFIREFGNLDIVGRIYPCAETANFESRNINLIKESGITNCLPVGRTFYWDDASIWMDVNGGFYLANFTEIFLIGNTPEEGFAFLLRASPITKAINRWSVGWMPPPWHLNQDVIYPED